MHEKPAENIEKHDESLQAEAMEKTSHVCPHCGGMVEIVAAETDSPQHEASESDAKERSEHPNYQNSKRQDRMSKIKKEYKGEE
jgi:uncharacterized Zn finger protein (UPF0148 family)